MKCILSSYMKCILSSYEMYPIFMPAMTYVHTIELNILLQKWHKWLFCFCTNTSFWLCIYDNLFILNSLLKLILLVSLGGIIAHAMWWMPWSYSFVFLSFLVQKLWSCLFFLLLYKKINFSYFLSQLFYLYFVSVNWNTVKPS